MRHSIQLAILLAALTGQLGCDAADGDIEIGEPDPYAAPDITGAYLAALTDLVGCDGVDVPLGWASGALDVEGTPEALTFVFSDGSSLAGLVDETFTYSFSGRVEVDGAQVGALEVVGEGLAFIGDDLWKLSGEIEVTASDSTDGANLCTLSAQHDAEQVGS